MGKNGIQGYEREDLEKKKKRREIQNEKEGKREE